MEMVEDLVLLILLWLPVKSLLRFKAVCKSWCSLIESSAFISQHLHHLDDQDEDNWNFITLEPSQPEFSLLSGNNFQFSHTLPFQNELGIRRNIIATCDGIVCLQHGDYPDISISLWNPATRQFTTLPKAPQPLPFNHPFLQDWVKFNYGFGIDIKSNDYKVVKIVIETEDAPFLLDTDDIPIPHSKVTTNIYSLSTNSWRAVDAVLPVHLITYNPKFPLRNGIYCWVGAAYEDGERTLIDRIFYFDFTTEMFGTIPLPDACDNSWLILGLITDNIACIRICGLVSTGMLHDIWVLNQNDANGSWTKISTVTIKTAGHLLGMSKNGKIVWKITYKSRRTIVHLLDPITQKKIILPIEGTSYYFQGAVYKESLLSVKGAIV